MAKSLQLELRRVDSWSQSEMALFHAKHSEMTCAEFAAHIGRSFNSVMGKARSLGLQFRARADLWSQDEIAFLRENHDTLPAAAIAEQLGRSLSAVLRRTAEPRRGSTLGLTSAEASDWTDSQRYYLRANLDAVPLKRLARTLGKSATAVAQEACRLGLEAQVLAVLGWTEKEIAYLRREDPVKSARELSGHLGRKERQVQDTAKALNLPIRRANGWSDSENAYLREKFGDSTVAEIAEHLGRDQGSVRRRLNTLGLKAVYSGGKGWRASAIAFLKDAAERMTVLQLAQHLGKSGLAVRKKLEALKLKAKRARAAAEG